MAHTDKFLALSSAGVRSMAERRGCAKAAQCFDLRVQLAGISRITDTRGTRADGLPDLVRVDAVAMSRLPWNGLRCGLRGCSAPATPAEADLLKLDQSTHIASWVDWKTHVPPPGEV
jgi:hypothetical protein